MKGIRGQAPLPQRVWRTWLALCLLLALTALTGCATTPTQDPSQPPPLPPELTTAFATAVAHIRDERYAEAEPVLARLSETYPDFPAIWANLGIAHAEQGEEAEAVEAFQQALRRQPGHPVAGNRLAMLHREAGRFEEARAFYEDVVHAHPDYAPARLNYGILCDIYLADLACAKEQYERYLALTGEDAQVNNWLGDLNRRLESGQ